MRRDVKILGRELAAERRHDRKETRCGDISQMIAQTRVPEMAMAIDKSRHHDAPARLDRLGPGRRAGIGRNARNGAGFYENICAIKVADLIVLSQDDRVLDENLLRIHELFPRQARPWLPDATDGRARRPVGRAIVDLVS